MLLPQTYCFLGCPIGLFVRPFIWSDIVTMISHERLEQYW